MTIIEGAVSQTSKDYFKPIEARAVLGFINAVEWTNNDSVGHTVTGDDPQYVDAINGKFDSLAHPEQTDANGFIKPDGSWSFTFTKAGEYTYHSFPHPWMKGKINVIVIDSFFSENVD